MKSPNLGFCSVPTVSETVRSRRVGNLVRRRSSSSSLCSYLEVGCEWLRKPPLSRRIEADFNQLNGSNDKIILQTMPPKVVTQQLKIKLK